MPSEQPGFGNLPADPETRPNFNPLTQHSGIDPKSGIDNWARSQIRIIALQMVEVQTQLSVLKQQMIDLLNALENPDEAEETKTDSSGA